MATLVAVVTAPTAVPATNSGLSASNGWPVKVTMIGPRTFVSGKPTGYQVKITNPGRTTFKKMKVRFQPADGVVKTIPIGKMDPGTGGHVFQVLLPDLKPKKSETLKLTLNFPPSFRGRHFVVSAIIISGTRQVGVGSVRPVTVK